MNDTGIADQLGFDQQQYQQVGQSYQQAWDRYQQARAQLGDDLSNEERSRRLSTLRDQFNRDFLEGAGQAFANPLQQQRFRQLQMQYQGYGAFSDPTLQDELQLSAEQIVRFNRMQEQWNQQLQQFQQGGQDGNYFRDSDAAQTQNGVRQTQFQDGGEGAQNGDPSQRFQQLMRQRWQQINNILDEDQRYRYYQSVGAPHDFPMEAYLQTGSGGGAAASAQGTTAPGAGVQDTETQGVNPQGTAPQGNTPGANTPQRSTTPQSSAPGTARDGAAGAASGQGNPRG